MRYFLPMARTTVELTAGYTFIAGGEQAPPLLQLDKISVNMLAPQIGPDVKRPYTLSLAPSSRSDDRFCVSFQPNGLLSEVKVISADRTGDIVERLAETAATFVTGVPDGGGMFDSLEIEKARGRFYFEPRPFATVVFDPDDASELTSANSVARANLALRIAEVMLDPVAAVKAMDEKFEGKKVAFRLSEAMSSVISNGAPVFAVDGAAPPLAEAPLRKGVYYRPMTERSFRVSAVGGAPRRFFATMPDVTVAEWVEVSRAALVRKSTTAKFTNGQLQSIEIDKPSEALAAVNMPLDIAGSVVETPARFFTAIGKSLRSETALIAAQAELIKARAEIEKVKRGETASPPTGAASDGTNTAKGATQTAPAAFLTEKCSA
jgi:hypothetical protein